MKFKVNDWVVYNGYFEENSRYFGKIPHEITNIIPESEIIRLDDLDIYWSSTIFKKVNKPSKLLRILLNA